MKKFLVLWVLVLTIAGASFGYSSPTPKLEGGYVLIDSATGSQIPLSAAQKSWHDVNADPNWVKIPTQIRNGYLSYMFEFTTDGNDPCGATVDVNILFARPYGSGKVAAKLNVRCGDVQVSHDPNSGVAYLSSAEADPNHKLADYVYKYSDVNEWKGVACTSGADGNEVGGNVGTFDIDPLMEQFTRVEFYNFSGTGITRVRCFMTGSASL
jgi:hypothetical protein